MFEKFCQINRLIKVKKIVYLAFLLWVAGQVIAQSNLPKYWISFTDKTNTPYSAGRPEEFLSLRSIERRTRQGIAITEDDLPVDPEYLDRVRNKGIAIINVSKWFNGALIELNDTAYLDTLRALDFVESKIVKVKPGFKDIPAKTNDSKFKTEISPLPVQYGYSYNQIHMINGDYLHELGFTGEGMLIAVLDAGFTNANSISSLEHIWDEDRVVAWKDFVKDGRGFFINTHNHGTAVFSIMGGFQPEILIGTAPNAAYILVRTEDVSSEYIIEEYNWVCGAEYADSLGADVINSSLGYTQFDDPSENHAYSDLNGRTAPISIAATMAARKGIIVSTSASNLGDDPWFHIGTPADADSILAVGAVDSDGIITNFSSRGPSFDGRVKPDIVAQGQNTVAQNIDGSFVPCSGTSCSSPVITGIVTCLWQANPHATNIQVMDAVRKSASKYFNPDSAYGYGIPNMLTADWMLKPLEEITNNTLTSFTLFPNPANDYFYLQVYRPEENRNETITLNFIDLSGRLQRQEIRQITGHQFVLEIRNIDNLLTGLYILEIELSGHRHELLFSKIN